MNKYAATAQHLVARANHFDGVDNPRGLVNFGLVEKSEGVTYQA